MSDHERKDTPQYDLFLDTLKDFYFAENQILWRCRMQKPPKSDKLRRVREALTARRGQV